MWVYCLDMSDPNPLEQLEALREEVHGFNRTSDRKELVIATKCDLLHKDTLLNLDSLYYKIRSRIGEEIPVVGTSARFGLGINRLVRELRTSFFPSEVALRRERVPAEFISSTDSLEE